MSLPCDSHPQAKLFKSPLWFIQFIYTYLWDFIFPARDPWERGQHFYSVIVYHINWQAVDPYYMFVEWLNAILVISYCPFDIAGISSWLPYYLVIATYSASRLVHYPLVLLHHEMVIDEQLCFMVNYSFSFVLL